VDIVLARFAFVTSPVCCSIDTKNISKHFAVNVLVKEQIQKEFDFLEKQLQMR